MEGWVYILKSQKNGRYYIGSSENPERRLVEFHNLGKVKATKLTKPWEIVFKQRYEEMSTARQIEYKLKSFKSKKIIEEIINDGHCRLSVD